MLFPVLVATCLMAGGMTPKWINGEGERGGLEIALLEAVHGRVRPMVCDYEGSKLTRTHTFSLGKGRTTPLAIGDAKWECELETKKLESGLVDLVFRFKLLSGEVKSSGVAVALDFDQWSPENYVFVPACVYNGNRFRVLDVPYPPMFYDKKDQRLDLPVTITNVQRLSASGEPSLIEMNTGNASTPAMGFKTQGTGFLMLTDQRSRFGNHGLFIEESADRKRACFVVSAPGVREGRLEMMGSVLSGDKGADLKAGDELSLRLRMYVFKAPSVGHLFDKFLAVRKEVSGPNEFRALTPYSEAFSILEKSLNGMRWLESGGYYKSGNGDSPFGHFQLGWVSGLMVTYPLLVQGDAVSRERSLKNLETILEKDQGKSGLLYGIYKLGQHLGDNFGEMEKRPGVAMVRKNADGLYFTLKQLMLLKQPKKDERVRAWADAFVRLWDKYGQIGQLVDVETGEIVVGGSTAGAIAPAALVLASEYFGDRRYVETAKKLARQYVERDLLHGYTTGGPGEILQCPDSESAFALLESLVVLYEATGEKEWLKAAEDAAALCSSWVVSYDYAFPPSSSLGRVGARATGAVWASIQNKHGAPGICTASGDCLLKLYRATGKTAYLDLLRDISHNIIEFLSRSDRPVGDGAQSAFINERVNLSDWEGKDSVGYVGDSSVSWNETAVLLTTVEVPGVYVRTDLGKAWVFDHIEAEVISKEAGVVMLKVKNPTKFNARVSILAETGANAKRPLGFTALSRWQKFNVDAGKEIVVRVAASPNR